MKKDFIIVVAVSILLAGCGRVAQSNVTDDAVQATATGTVATTYVTDEPYSNNTDGYTRDGTYTGEWRDGAPNGDGVWTYDYVTPDSTEVQKRVDEGTFTDGMLDGEGRRSTDTPSYGTTVIVGTFVEGSIRHGRMDLPDGSYAEGDFDEWGLCGNSVMWLAPTDQLLEGEFANSVLVTGTVTQHGTVVFDGTLTDRNGNYVGGTLWGDDPEFADKGYDDADYAKLETAILDAIVAADPDAIATTLRVDGLRYGEYSLRQAVLYFWYTHPEISPMLLFTYEQAYADDVTA